MHALSLTIRGTVVAGFRKARAIGFPTANIDIAQKPNIAEGVYLGWAILQDSNERIPTLVFYGKPHSIPEVVEPRIEAHLLGEASDVYGKSIELELILFIRPNQKFKHEDDLSRAIKNDFDKAVRFFKSTKHTVIAIRQWAEKQSRESR